MIKEMEREGKISDIKRVYYDNIVLSDDDVESILASTISVIVSVRTAKSKQASTPLINLACRATNIIHLRV